MGKTDCRSCKMPHETVGKAVGTEGPIRSIKSSDPLILPAFATIYVTYDVKAIEYLISILSGCITITKRRTLSNYFCAKSICRTVTREGEAMKIEINYKNCKQCGLCIAFCPKKVFTTRIDGSPDPVNAEACINCKQCVLRCPDLAIKIEEKKSNE